MLTIALCDDEAESLSVTKDLLDRYIEARPSLNVKASAFSSAVALMNRVEDAGGFDVYVLDVIMPQKNGIEAGLDLRRLGCDGAIIYVTASPDYAVDSYLARAANYILKPISEPSLFMALDQAAEQIDRRKAAGVTIRTRENDARVLFDDIAYMELVKRTVCYHLRDGRQLSSVTVSGSFQDAVAPVLSDRRFALCGSSYAVNLFFVTAVGKTDLTLKDGRKVPLPRQSAGAVKKQWVNYWLGSDMLHG